MNRYNKVNDIDFTYAAANRIECLLKIKKNKNLKLRIYIIGGGCSGFQYKFIFDNKINDGDIIIEKNNVKLIIDYLSYQYLIGGKVDYIEKIEGSKFVVFNPNAVTTCSCGSSFSI